MGIQLRLLQMAWPAGQTSALSAATAAVLAGPAALLSRLPAAGWAAVSTAAATELRAPTANVCYATGASASQLRATAGASAAGTATRLLVLHQRQSRLHNARGMQSQGRTVLSDKRRSGAALPESLLVLHQRARGAR